MDEATVKLRQAKALLAEVAAMPVSGRTDEDTCLFVNEAEQSGRLIDTIRATSAAEVEHRSRYELGSAGLARRYGQVKGVHLLEQLTRVSQAEAARRIRLGMAIRPETTLDGRPLPAPFPHVAAAMTAGTLGADAAAGIIRCLTQASPTACPVDVAAAEATLVDAAGHQSADLVLIQARVLREALDPDGAEPRDEELRHRRGFTIGREVNGMSPLSGWADPTSSALLRAMFAEGANPAAAPRFISAEDIARGTETITTPEGDIVETVTDPRTKEQRQLDILVGTVTAGLRRTESRTKSAPGSMRSMTTVMAVVQLKDLQNGTGVGWLDDVAEPVSAITMQQLACDAGYRRILLGDDGEVLHLGLAQRLFSAAQRKALAVRDGGCVWPQCTAPPSWCEAHHVLEYESDGPTNIDNGALLCSAHHHMLHASEFTMRMIRGKPRLLAPPWLDPDQVWQPLGRTRAIMTARLRR